MNSEVHILNCIGQDIRGHCTDLDLMFINKNEYKNPELEAVKIMEKILKELNTAKKVALKIRKEFSDVEVKKDRMTEEDNDEDWRFP